MRYWLVLITTAVIVIPDVYRDGALTTEGAAQIVVTTSEYRVRIARDVMFHALELMTCKAHPRRFA
jgi:hypothetical protein